MLIQSTLLKFVILLHLGAKKGYTQLTHLEPAEHDDDYYRDICEIEDSFKSPYIRAFYEEAPLAEGCAGGAIEEEVEDINMRPTSAAQEIHVIRVLSSPEDRTGSAASAAKPRHNGGVRINLQIKSQESINGLLERKLTFVLVSDISIKWKIHLEGINHSSELNFWVSNGSHVMQDRRLSMRTHQLTRHQSSSQPLLDWISQKLGPVTTIVEVKPSRSLVHLVGIADMAKMCEETVPETTAKEIGGCLSTWSKGRKNKDVHILELRDNAAGAGNRDTDGFSRSVAIDIHPRSDSKPLLRKHLMLVLKSHRPTSWKIRTYGLRGTLDIVTDNVVDTSSITMQTVGVVTERLSSLSGIDLVVWTSEKYGEPISYTFARLANKFDLTVDGRDDVDSGSSLKPQVVCNPNSMTISLSKGSLTNKFAATHLSLNDRSCQAQKNRTHYFWTMSLTSCGTIRMPHKDRIAYNNAIVIHRPRSVGGRLSDQSGSGLEPQIDEENFDSENSGDVRLDFQCAYPSANMEERKYSLKLYKDPNFQLEMLHFPAFVSDGETLFLEATVDEDLRTQLVISNCSLLFHSDQPNHPLIRDGCPHEDRIKWSGMSSAGSRRFQFVFEKSWSGGSVGCVLSTCEQATSEHRSEQIPPCLPLSQICPVSGGRNGLDPMAAAAGKSVSIGPLVLQESPSSSVARTETVHQESSTQIMMMMQGDCDQIIHTEGLDPAAVVGIAFAAFTIGVLLTGALWFIHSHTGPIKKHAKGLRSAEASGESTPSSTAPMAIRPAHHHV